MQVRVLPEAQMKFNKINNSSWEIEIDQTDQLRKVGIEICGAAHTEGFGKVDEHTPEEFRVEEMYFKIHFNGLLIEFVTKRELWMFGLGLRAAAEAIPIQLIGLIPVKANN